MRLIYSNLEVKDRVTIGEGLINSDRGEILFSYAQKHTQSYVIVC